MLMNMCNYNQIIKTKVKKYANFVSYESMAAITLLHENQICLEKNKPLSKIQGTDFKKLIISKNSHPAQLQFLIFYIRFYDGSVGPNMWLVVQRQLSHNKCSCVRWWFLLIDYKQRYVSIMYKTPTHALYVQHYIILTC